MVCSGHRWGGAGRSRHRKVLKEHEKHYSDVIMSAMASQITGVWMVCSTVCSGADQRKHQSSASLVFVRGIHRWPLNSPHKGPVTRKRFPFDDVATLGRHHNTVLCNDAFIFDGHETKASGKPPNGGLFKESNTPLQPYTLCLIT